MNTKPLKERKHDWFFIIAFSIFFLTSMLTDSVNGLNGSLEPDSWWFMERIVYNVYAKHADPLLIVNPPVVRVSAFISAFIWGPLYLYFIAAFIKGWNQIRAPGLVYGGALTHGMTTYMAEGLFGAYASPNPLYYITVNSPYWLVPALMIIRLWKPNPFSKEPEEG